MEQEALFPILKSHGCPLERLSDTQGVQRVVWTLLRKNGARLPDALPEHHAARFRLCSTMAEQVQSLGYREELGFEAFLYPNPVEVRRILIFLLDQLSATDTDVPIEAQEERCGYLTSLLRQFCAKPLTCTLRVNFDPERLHMGDRDGAVLTHHQTTPSRLLPSLIAFNHHWNAHENESKLYPGQNLDTPSLVFASTVDDLLLLDAFDESRRQKAEHPYEVALTDASMETTPIEEEIQEDESHDVEAAAARAAAEEQERAAYVNRIQRKIDELQKRLEINLERERDLQDKVSALDADFKAKETDMRMLKDRIKANQRMNHALSSPENNKQKLVDAIAKLKHDREILQAEWDNMRAPLEQCIQDRIQREQEASRLHQAKVKQLEQLRLQMASMRSQNREKKTLYKDLQQKLSNLQDRVNRMVYIKQIMGIMKNLDKQQAEIDRILNDIRMIQKELNTVSEQSLRNMKSAKRLMLNATSRVSDIGLDECFLLLESFDHTFHQLVDKVSGIAKLTAQQRELETRIDTLVGLNYQEKLKQVTHDLQTVQSENTKLNKV